MTSSTHTIAGVRWIDVESPGLPATDPIDVVVVDGRVVEVRPAVGSGPERFMLSGLVNAHDHLYSKELRRPDPGMDIAAMRRRIDTRDEIETFAVMVRNSWAAMTEGVLVVRDLGARHGLNTKLAASLASGILPGPEVIAAGRPIVMTGGHVWTFGREADGPDDCRRAVREQRKAGAQVIKVMASGGLSNFPHEDYTVSEFTSDELEAITGEAAKLGLPTCAHAFGTDAIEAAVAAGIDSIEHGVHLAPATVERMAEKEISYVPTVANMRRIASPELNRSAGVAERADRFRREIVEPQAASVRRAVEAGLRIGVGTDSTGTYREELAALVDAGMSAEQVVRAATVDGAAICRVETPRMEPGSVARFCLYDHDPRGDVTRLVEPVAVVSGRRYHETAELGRLVQEGSR